MRVLVLAPHTDDGQLGCGGTIARHVAEGDTVCEAAFSFTKELGDEWDAALDVLGVKDRRAFDYPPRRFHEHRQDILDDLIAIREALAPEVVYVPSSSDRHQDHEVIRQEAFRAFKSVSILGYELPWNNVDFSATHYVRLTKAAVATKAVAIKRYTSQTGRTYTTEAFIWSWAHTRGVAIGRQYAEAFEVIRWVR